MNYFKVKDLSLEEVPQCAYFLNPSRNLALPADLPFPSKNLLREAVYRFGPDPESQEAAEIQRELDMLPLPDKTPDEVPQNLDILIATWQEFKLAESLIFGIVIIQI